jgi:hypothetical protein
VLEQAAGALVGFVDRLRARSWRAQIRRADPATQRLPAVDQQRGAGDLPGLIGCQEGDCCGDIIGLADPPERDAGGEAREEAGGVAALLLPQAQRRPPLVI